ncbi:MAG: hypothetical protein WDM80_07620 [Limisphaerales bacterium]
MILKNKLFPFQPLLASLSLFLAFATWRKELKGKSEYQKAKDILKAVYRVKNGFMVVRSPWMDSSEYSKECFDENGHLKKGMEFEGQLYAYQTRMKNLEEAFAELESQTLDAQVEWGKEFVGVIIPFRLYRHQLVMAIQNHLQTKKLDGGSRLSPEEKKDIRPKLYYVCEDDATVDPFTAQINQAIEGFEKRLRPHINKKSAIARLLQNPAANSFIRRIFAAIERARKQMET